MKKIRFLAVAALACLTLTACGGDNTTVDDDTTVHTEDESSQPDTAKSDETSSGEEDPTTPSSSDETSKGGDETSSGDNETSSSDNETSSDEDTDPSSGSNDTSDDSSQTETHDYYLVGDFNEWQVVNDYKLTPNAQAEGEYYINGVELPAASGIKIRDPELGDDGWYAYKDNSYNFWIEKHGVYDVYFNINGNENWGNSYIYVSLINEIIDDNSSSGDDTSGSGESSSEETVVDYYLVGDFNDWTYSDEVKMTPNSEASGEYYLMNIELPADSNIKVQDPLKGDDGWYAYSDNSYNFWVEKHAVYNVYFNINGNENWGNSYIYVSLINEIIDDNSSSGDDTSGSGESSSEETVVDYYLVGDFNEWTYSDEVKMTPNSEASGEYYLMNVELPANSNIKVQDPLKGDEGWYSYSDNKNNFWVEKHAVYNVYFNINGNENWGNALIYLDLVEEISDGGEVESVEVTFVDGSNSGFTNVYIWLNASPWTPQTASWPGTAIGTLTLPANVELGIIFNNGTSQTGDMHATFTAKCTFTYLGSDTFSIE